MDKSIYIQGIAGTFMGGIAQLAREKGIEVTGSDHGVYPPMSTLLDQHNIVYFNEFSKENLKKAKFERIVVGNIMSRGNEEVEAMLNDRSTYSSGPQWLSENIIAERPVLAIAGTHGKTTTSSMCAHILDEAGAEPGFLIGGKPGNFDTSARLGKDWFVIESDEYDCAFFDKRSKFVHYRPKIAVLNNLEFDHADIFNSLADIERQFHHMVRIVPQNGALIVRKNDEALNRVLEMGVWTPIEYFGFKTEAECKWQVDYHAKRSLFYVEGELIGEVSGNIIAGGFNALNALAAIAACNKVGIEPKQAVDALQNYIRPKKRLDVLFENDNCIVIEDFAHHPTAIRETLTNIRQIYRNKRIIAVIEKGSNSMAGGSHDEALAEAFTLADEVFLLAKNHPTSTHANTHTFTDVDTLIESLKMKNLDNHCYIFMSNRSFGGVPSRFYEWVSLKYTY